MTRRTQHKTTVAAPPKLQIPRVEADKLVSSQLAEGEAIDARLSAGEVDSKASETEIRVWRDFTAEVLRRLFDTSEYSETFANAAAPILFADVRMFTVSGPHTPFREPAKPDPRQVLAAYLVKLRLIQKSLPLVPEIPEGQAPTTESSTRPTTAIIDQDPIETNARILLGIMVEQNLRECSNAELQELSGIEDGHDINDALEWLVDRGAIEVNWISATTSELAFGMVTMKGKAKSLHRGFDSGGVGFPPTIINHYHTATGDSAISKIRVLFLAANPDEQNRLALDEEMRAIKQKVRASEHRDLIEVVSEWAVRPDDLIQALNEHKPHIVHFSGHGSQTDQLLLCGVDGTPKPVPKAALSRLFKTLTGNIQVVVLNACYSRNQAEAITDHVSCAIGMKDSISDAAAIVFASSFYRALGFGRSVFNAFEQGVLSLLMEGLPEEDIPELLTGDGVDSDTIVLVKPLTT